MFCPNCGKKIADNSRFCEFCGAEVLLPGIDGAADDAEPEYAEQSEIDGLDVNRPGAECENTEAGTGTGGVDPDMPEPEGSDTAAVSDNGGNDVKNRKRRMIIILIVIAAAAAVVVIAFAMFKFSEKKQQEEWQDQYDLGEQALLDEDYEQAVVNFTEAIEIDPEEPDAYMGRAKAYIGTGETEENMTAAIADCETVIDLDQTYIDAYIYESDIYADSGNFESAIDILEKGKKANPEDEEIPKKIDEIEDRQEKKEAADRYQAYYDKLMELQEMYGKAALKALGNKNTDDIIMYYWTGMFFAKLLDFDGDGEEELITAVYDPDENSDFYENWGYDYDGYLISVWAYEDDAVQEVYQQDEMYAFSSGADDSGCIIVEREEIWYMVTGYVSGDADLDDCYYSYDAENMTFSIEKRFELDWIDDYYSFRIDGEDAEEEEFYEEISIWNEELSEELKYYFLWDEWADDEWVDETVGDVSEELEETLETLMSFLGIEAEDEDLITDSEALYQAYYDKLMELQETYGEAELCSVEYEFSETYSYTICRWEGLYYAMLLDFDGDGQEELVTALYDPDADDQDEEQDGQVIQVWNYEDGEVQELYRQDLLIMGERYYYGCVIEIHEDNCYILDGYYGGDGSYEWYYEEYYTLESGSFCMAKSFDKYGMTAGCQVDGKDVSTEKLSEARDAWTEDLTEKLTYVFLWEDGYEYDTEMTTSAVLQETISELAQILGIEAE